MPGPNYLTQPGTPAPETETCFKDLLGRLATLPGYNGCPCRRCQLIKPDQPLDPHPRRTVVDWKMRQAGEKRTP